ncbi:isoprenyl transferase [Candidatus Margulisiibacteriota bacterium]
MFNIFRKKTDYPVVDTKNIPMHVAIIMDGNGRWAQRRGLPREAGHAAGQDALHRAIEAAAKLKVQFLTVYAFSTENWKRPQKEINALMNLLKKGVSTRLEELTKNSIRVKVLGRINEFPQDVQAAIKQAEQKTRKGESLTLNIMLNYGGQAEITDAVRKIAQDIDQKKILPEDISEKTIAEKLYTAGLPEPDLLIRTSGEQRISNFLLWQTAYSEFYFTKTLWPDFKQEHFVQAVLEYQKRKRRKGDVV